MYSINHNLIGQREQGAYTAFDPMVLALLGRQQQVQHEVGGVSGGGQDPAPLSRAIQRAGVVREGAALRHHHRLEDHVRVGREKHLKQRSTCLSFIFKGFMVSSTGF